MSVMGIAERPRRIGDLFERHQTGVSELTAGKQQIGEFMRPRMLELRWAVLRHLAVPLLTMILGVGSAMAQSGDLKAQDQSGKPASNNPADAQKDNQRKTDEFAEAAQAINGPAGNPECVWLGRRVVRLMYRDDLDTACPSYQGARNVDVCDTSTAGLNCRRAATGSVEATAGSSPGITEHVMQPCSSSGPQSVAKWRIAYRIER